MHALILSTTYRIADNWLPLFQAIHHDGGLCEWVLMPWLGDPSHGRMVDLTKEFPVRGEHALSALTEQGISRAELKRFLTATCTSEIDVLFLCDVQAYPSCAVMELLEELPSRPLVIGLQHGLFQSWWMYNTNFCADHMLVFGERHCQMLLPAWRERTTAVGLPKLDRLKDVPVHDGGYIAYLAQNVVSPALLTEPFEELQARTGELVLERDHPQYPAFPAGPASGAGVDYVGYLATSNWVITPHSTGGLEALYLGKPVVLLPNAGLTAWTGYPGIAWQFTAQAMLDARERLGRHPADTAQFLDEVVGGIRFDHTARALAAVQALL